MATTYKGYEFSKTPEGVAVSDPRFSRTMFVAADVADARQWVNAYREGRVWATQAVLA